MHLCTLFLWLLLVLHVEKQAEAEPNQFCCLCCVCVCVRANVCVCVCTISGYGDSVLCHSCGIGLRHWEPVDDPWIEHARWRPLCEFVRSVQGQHFIDAACEMSRNSRHVSSTTNLFTSNSHWSGVAFGSVLDFLK